MGLNDDFQSFVNSPEAKKPAFSVREDWREFQEEQAYLNGDMAADRNPNTDYTSSWSEPDFYRPTDEELEDLEFISKISRKERKANLSAEEELF